MKWVPLGRRDGLARRRTSPDKDPIGHAFLSLSRSLGPILSLAFRHRTRAERSANLHLPLLMAWLSAAQCGSERLGGGVSDTQGRWGFVEPG